MDPNNQAPNPNPEPVAAMPQPSSQQTLTASVDYYVKAIGVPKKGILSYDGTNVILQGETGETVFQTPLAGVEKVSRSTVYLYITVGGHKYSVVFGGASGAVLRGAVGGAIGVVAQSAKEKSTGIDDWVALFTQAGVMSSNLSTGGLAKKVLIGCGIAFGVIIVLFILIVLLGSIS